MPTVAGVGVFKVPPKITPPLHRIIQGQLAPGTAVTNGTNVQELINITNCAGFIVRILTATATGNLVVNFVRPNVLLPIPAGSSGTPGGTYGYTTYATNQPTGSPVAVSAATEAFLAVTAGGAGGYNGESYVLIQFQPTLSGTITWCDIALRAQSY